uniref:(northern house mosquito) hypothetical protein n=1 Tax=Culex pipiens TaxID=7175 RepID=A0A8D8DS82_CULPI
MPKSLASFCRLCLTKTASKVPVFGGDQENVTNLLALIELSINSRSEPDAAVCFDCIVTLEAFLQFKDQCHVNNHYLKTVPSKNDAEDSEASGEEEEEDEEDEDEDAMDCDFLDEDDADGSETIDSEEEGLVAELEPPRSPVKRTLSLSPMKMTEIDPLDITKCLRKQTAKPECSQKRTVDVPKKPVLEIPKLPELPEPTEEDLPKLQDSYPDYFHFEKGKKSRYFDLVYHGKRFNSAIYGTCNTIWQCAHRRKYRCSAVLQVSKDYTNFEPRNEHTHGNLKTKGESELFTPQQALPIMFRISWKKNQERKAKRVAMSRVMKERLKIQRAKAKAEAAAERERIKAARRKKPIPKIPEFPGPQPAEDELPKLQDSYPDYLYFERGPNTLYYDLVYYGERYNSAIFGSRYTFWQCSHRRKFKCPATVHVTNDYTEFERRYEHSHGEQPSTRNVELYTPKQALPTLFRICWHRVKETSVKRLQLKELRKDKILTEEYRLGDIHDEPVEEELSFVEEQADDSDDSFTWAD